MHADGGATPAPGCGQTLAEVADVLGVSKDAVRRRLKAGQLGGHQIASPHGPAWCVHLDSPVEARQGGDTPAPTVAQGSRNGGATVVQPVDVAALIELVDRLQGENRELAVAAAIWQERAGTLADRLALAESRLAAITAPETSQGAVEGQPAPEHVATPSEVLAPLSVPWWRRWRSWLAAGLVVAVVGLASCQTQAAGGKPSPFPAQQRGWLCEKAQRDFSYISRIGMRDAGTNSPGWEGAAALIAVADKVC